MAIILFNLLEAANGEAPGVVAAWRGALPPAHSNACTHTHTHTHLHAHANQTPRLHYAQLHQKVHANFETFFLSFLFCSTFLFCQKLKGFCIISLIAVPVLCSDCTMYLSFRTVLIPSHSFAHKRGRLGCRLGTGMA